MYVINIKDLETEGVSLSQIKQSLEIECFNKIFHRSSDLPKKFKDKAFNICQELREKGKHSFITETNYSYTIWQEKNLPSQEVNKHNLTAIKEIRSNSQSKEDSLNDSLSIDSKQQLTDSQIKNQVNNRLNNPAKIVNHLTANNFHSAVSLAASIAKKRQEIQELEAQLKTNLQENEFINDLPLDTLNTSDEVSFENDQDSLGVQIASNIARAKKKVRMYRGVIY